MVLPTTLTFISKTEQMHFYFTLLMCVKCIQDVSTCLDTGGPSYHLLVSGIHCDFSWGQFGPQEDAWPLLAWSCCRTVSLGCLRRGWGWNLHSDSSSLFTPDYHWQTQNICSRSSILDLRNQIYFPMEPWLSQMCCTGNVNNAELGLYFAKLIAHVNVFPKMRKALFLWW